MNYHQLAYKDQKKSLILDINKFVKHSDVIYKKSPNINQKTHEMIDKIQQVKDCLHDLNAFTNLLTICKRIFLLRKKFYEILPNPNNNSYESSLERLNDILTFCSLYIRSKQKLTA